MSRITSAIAAATLGACALLSVQASAQQRPQPQGQNQGQRGPGPQDQRGWGGEHGGNGMGRPDPAKMFAEMDANHDGMVSKAEFTSFHERHRMGPPPGDRPGPPPPRR